MNPENTKLETEEQNNILSPTMQDIFAQIDELKNDEVLEENPQDETTKPEKEGEQEQTDDLAVNEDEDENELDIEEIENPQSFDKKEKKKLKPWELNRKMHAFMEKAKVLEAQLHRKEMENAELVRQLNLSLDSGIYQSAKSAQMDVELAKQQKIKALLDGDANGAVEADIALNEAVIKLNEVKKLAYQNNYNNAPETYNNQYSQQSSQSSNYNEQEVATELINDWIEDHPYLVPSSDEFDQSVFQQVEKFVGKLNQNLEETGKMNIYLSDKYFKTIDKYIDKLKSESSKRSENIKNASRINGVKSAFTTVSTSKPKSRKLELSKEELELAKAWGISPERYALRKAEDQLKYRYKI